MFCALRRCASSSVFRRAAAPVATALPAPLSAWGMLTALVRHHTPRPRMTFKRRFRGLFGGKHIQFGNKISWSKKKTRRSWLPNIQRKRFWSEKYQRFLQFRATTYVIKQVKRCTRGIDQYLVQTPNMENKKSHGLLYKRAISLKKNQMYEDKKATRAYAIGRMSPEERVAEGLPPTGIAVGWRFIPEEQLHKQPDDPRLQFLNRAPHLTREIFGVDMQRIKVKPSDTTQAETRPTWLGDKKEATADQ